MKERRGNPMDGEVATLEPLGAEAVEAAGLYLAGLLERMAAGLSVQTEPRPSPAAETVPAVRVRFNRD